MYFSFFRTTDSLFFYSNHSDFKHLVFRHLVHKKNSFRNLFQLLGLESLLLRNFPRIFIDRSAATVVNCFHFWMVCFFSTLFSNFYNTDESFYASQWLQYNNFQRWFITFWLTFNCFLLLFNIDVLKMASKIFEWYAEEGNPRLLSRYIDKYSTHQPKVSSFLNFTYQTHIFLYYSLSSEDLPFLLFELIAFLPCLENCTHVSRTYEKRSLRTLNISWFRSPSIYILINAFCLWSSWKASKDFNFTLTIDENYWRMN